MGGVESGTIMGKAVPRTSADNRRVRVHIDAVGLEFHMGGKVPVCITVLQLVREMIEYHETPRQVGVRVLWVCMKGQNGRQQPTV